MNYTNMAIWLYGSYARGDEDLISDIDILVVADKNYSLNELSLPPNIVNDKTSISYYSWPEIKKMSAYGSLFLHHLRQEARPLFESNDAESRLTKILSSLGQYKNAKKDINAFYIIIQDVEESIKRYFSFEYELGVLATILRHSSILGCYLIGQPQFNRKTPVKTLVELWNLDPEIYKEFDNLYSFKLTRKHKVEEIFLDYVVLWCNRIKSLLQKIEQQVLIYERTMFKPN